MILYQLTYQLLYIFVIAISCHNQEGETYISPHTPRYLLFFEAADCALAPKLPLAT